MQLKGLSLQDVEARRLQGLVNVNTDVKTKSIGQIVAQHCLTLFNGLNLALALAGLPNSWSTSAGRKYFGSTSTSALPVFLS